MPESLLTILKFVLVALIWLFFLRAIRAAWAEMRPPREAPRGRVTAAQPRPTRAEARADLRLRVLEPDSQRGRTFELADELTVGRAAGCGVALENDTFASKVHARIYRDGRQLWVEDLGSTNGTFVNAARVATATPLQRGDRLQVGQTVLEVAR